MEWDFERSAVLLLLIAAAVAILSRRLHLPYIVGLVAAGMALAPFVPQVELTRELIFTGLLPPLIFEAAFHLRWSELRRDLLVVIVLATAGVLISAAFTGAGMFFLARWDWRSALLFGVLIAATDPISVIALFREAGVHGRLRLLVEAESLFNDGTAAVAYGIALTLASGGQISAWGAVGTAFTTTGGGLLCGALVGQLTLFLIKRTEDYLVETACTAIGAYGSFLLADSLGISGVFATLAAGLMLGNLGPLRVISERGREAVEAFWEFAAFVANSVVFLLVGMSEINSHFGAQWQAAVIAMLVVTASRAASIYPLCSLFSRSSLRLSGPQRHVLFWAGLRGALALALAISIPSSVARHQEIVTVSFAVVAFSIFAHGLTIAPLMRRVGAIPRESLSAHRKHSRT